MATIEFKLPDIGEGVAEGEITKWLVTDGEQVTEDQIMVEVMTDKATVEIGSPVDGKVEQIRAAEGDTIPVGEVIVVLSSATGAPRQHDHGAAGGAGARSTAASATSKSATSREPSRATKQSGASGTNKGAATSAGGDLDEVDFALPDIGEGVAEGEITRWLVSEGERVTEDQPMLEVMTDKATVEIGSPVDGTVLRLLHAEGETVPVGEVLLVLGAEGGAPVRDGQRASRSATPSGARHAAEGHRGTEGDTGGFTGSGLGGGTALATAPRASTLSDTGLASRADGTRRVRAAPAVRRLAREMGLDISRLEGSGPKGRIRMDDVRAAGRAASASAPAVAPKPTPASPRPATSAPPPAPAPRPVQGDERVPLRGLRKRIAAQMRVSKQTAAHFAYVEELDLTELVALRGQAKAAAADKGVKLTYMPFIIKAICAGLRQFPLLNASLDEAAGELVYHGAINMGIAVETEAGLIVPVIRDADRKSMLETSRELFELAERARAGKTRPEDVGGGTFTITNAGNIGGLLATPIINVPEVAIVGVHAIRRRPWVVDEQIVIRDIMYLSLSLDHRVVDGAVGARFMNVVKQLLEQPALMLLEG